MATEIKTFQKKPSGKTVKPKAKKVSRTWLAFQEAIKNPGIEIVDMRAVLK